MITALNRALLENNTCQLGFRDRREMKEEGTKLYRTCEFELFSCQPRVTSRYEARGNCKIQSDFSEYLLQCGS